MGKCESKSNQQLKHITNMTIEDNQNITKNSINSSNIGDEKLIGDNIPISIEITDKAKKSICKIIIKNNEGNGYATGFFMEINDNQKYLITNYHVISQETLNEDIEIEIYNHNKMKLNFNNRDIKYFPKPRDITIIEIKNNDSIYNDIEFLDYDYNYKKGYIKYKNARIITLEHPLGKSAHFAIGRIININNFEFDHSIPTEKGSSGCPIMLYTEDINLIQVIGIHKKANYSNNFNCGTFIGEIFNNENIKENNNHIIAEFDIKDDDINKEIGIINSYEENQRLRKHQKIEFELMNEKEIKDCEIRINDILIPFNYYYKFPNKGKYIIKSTFNNYFIKTNYMFSRCSSFTNINLSNFNTQNVINMNNMFSFCSSLTNINLSNFNTQNVNNMESMFYECSSLTNINLSNFNTQNVTDMKGMFSNCSSLIDIDLSNFNTQNVTDMSFMFYECSSLKNINLSSFNTQNVTLMNDMFSFCSSLTNINLSNFNTQNVIDMHGLFWGCLSLTHINLSNFNTQNVKDMSFIFPGSSLRKENIITNDKRLLEQYNNC